MGDSGIRFRLEKGGRTQFGLPKEGFGIEKGGGRIFFFFY